MKNRHILQLVAEVIDDRLAATQTKSSPEKIEVEFPPEYFVLESFGFGVEATGGRVRDARRQFKAMMSQKEERIKKLSRFLEGQEISLDTSAPNLQALSVFFFDGITSVEDRNVELYGWSEFCLDLSVFVGEAISSRIPELEWCILEERDKSSISFHRFGLKVECSVGDRFVAYFDPFEFVFDYAENLLGGREMIEENRQQYFVELILSNFLKEHLEEKKKQQILHAASKG